MSQQGCPRLPGSWAASPLDIAYLRRADAALLAPDQLIAAVHFGRDATAEQPWEIGVPLPVHGDDDVVEVWRSHRPVEHGEIAGVRFTCTGDVLFGAVRIDEGESDTALEEATLAAYRAIGTALTATGYRSLCRLWNFFPAIHAAEAGLERYRAFCRGRHLALTEIVGDGETSLPAASAIGTRSPGVLVYGLALREPGHQLENPRQLSAFRYPPEYGPRSPSFSRSILKRWDDGLIHLYVSGTASIVGHSSRHQRDFARQLEETLANLDALLAAAVARTARPFRFELLRVYARSEPPMSLVRERIAARFGAATPVLVLQGDICRQDLLVEIEGLAISDG